MDAMNCESIDTIRQPTQDLLGCLRHLRHARDAAQDAGYRAGTPVRLFELAEVHAACSTALWKAEAALWGAR